MTMGIVNILVFVGSSTEDLYLNLTVVLLQTLIIVLLVVFNIFNKMLYIFIITGHSKVIHYFINLLLLFSLLYKSFKNVGIPWVHTTPYILVP